MAIPSAFQKAHKLSTCLKASRLRRRRIFGVLLETRHSPRPLSLCLQSAHLWAAARWYVCGLYSGFTNSLREHLAVPEYILSVCFRQVLKSPSGTLRAATFTRFILLRIKLGKLFVFQTVHRKDKCDCACAAFAKGKSADHPREKLVCLHSVLRCFDSIGVF